MAQKAVRLGFERDLVEIELDSLHCAVPLPAGIKETVKFLQIRSSVKTIGVVEPIVVAPDKSRPKCFIVLDGRMRLEALRYFGFSRAMCLISTDDEGFTYNKRVNRLSVVQSNRMILRAVERGVSVQQLADALNLTPGSIRLQFKLLEGICDEAVALLADKPATRGMFHVLRQMKPFRQIDVAQSMINLGDYSVKMAMAMLHTTPADQLTEQAAAKAQQGGPTEALQRLERELAALQADTRLLEDSYGPANLQLEIIKTYVERTLLESASVVRWLAQTRPEYLQQLQLIANVKQLPVH